MTTKEIQRQLALGTLPLWKRIELNEVEFKEITITLETCILMRIECENVIATYYPNDPRSRQVAINRMIKNARILKL